MLANKNKLALILGAIGALGAIVTVLAYLDNKKHEKLKTEIMALDKELKEHELKSKKSIT